MALTREEFARSSLRLALFAAWCAVSPLLSVVVSPAVLLSQTFVMKVNAALVPQIIGVPFFIPSSFLFLCGPSPGLGRCFPLAYNPKSGRLNGKDDKGLSLNKSYPKCALNRAGYSQFSSPRFGYSMSG